MFLLRWTSDTRARGGTNSTPAPQGGGPFFPSRKRYPETTLMGYTPGQRAGAVRSSLCRSPTAVRASAITPTNSVVMSVESASPLNRGSGVQRLSRNVVVEGTPESVAHSAEGGQNHRSRLKFARNLTVRNIESRCNQQKLGHPSPVKLNG
jgi:hypothetical protein